MQYHMFKKLHGDRIFFAPLHNPRRILDIGTGTGIWPIDMASIFPHATIYGTDLSPIQPRSVPENVFFCIDDCREPDWLWPPGHFDFIHTGMLLGSLERFSELIRTARKYLQPGSGWLECHEMHPSPFVDDGSAPADYTLRTFEEHLNEGANSVRPPRSLRIADKCKRWMLEAGFVDVHERIEKVPINPWPKDPRLKEIGTFNEANWLDGVAGFSYHLLGSKGLGWSKDEIEVFLIGVRKSIRNRRIHAYNKHVGFQQPFWLLYSVDDKQYIVYGRRPSPAEEQAMLEARKKGDPRLDQYQRRRGRPAH